MHRKAQLLLTLPPAFWLTVLFFIPSLIVFVVAFKPSDPFGGIGVGWSLENLAKLASEVYFSAGYRTLWISFASTLSCVLISLPVAYSIARSSRIWQQRLLILVIVPFWISFLVRIFAWRTLLHPEGFIKNMLVAIGLVSEETSLLYNTTAVVVVTIYTFLPFAILPMYAAIEKFDFALLEAAFDLGASKVQAFLKVFIPGIRQGLITAALLVFIPALGSYIIPDLVGGTDSDLLGNKIAQRVFTDRDLPQAASIAAALSLLTIIPLFCMFIARQKKTS